MKVLSRLNSLLAGSAVVAIAAIGGAGVAQADAYEKSKVVYERPATWTGVYFGLHSGNAWSDTNAIFPFAPPVGGGPQGYGVNQDTPVVGGQIGIQQQFGQLVVGVEGNLTSAFRDAPGVSFCPNTANLCTERFDDVITYGGRLGWAMGKYMPYASAGYANAGFSQRSIDTISGVPISQSRDRASGYYVGGGLDYMIAPNWTLGVEYRHFELDGIFVVPSTPAGVTTGLVNGRSLDFTLDTVTARVSWKFDWTGGGMK